MANPTQWVEALKSERAVAEAAGDPARVAAIDESLAVEAAKAGVAYKAPTSRRRKGGPVPGDPVTSTSADADTAGPDTGEAGGDDGSSGDAAAPPPPPPG